MSLFISIFALCIALYALSETFNVADPRDSSEAPDALAAMQARVRALGHNVGSNITGISYEEAEACGCEE